MHHRPITDGNVPAVLVPVAAGSLDNGLLYVDVVREVPEAAKPRTIKIGTTVEPVQPQVLFSAQGQEGARRQ